MTVSIYQRLFKYQQTADRSNLENFCTEILCDYLNRISQETTNSFLKDVLLSGKPELVRREVSEALLTSSSKIHWITQQSVQIGGTNKYPDLVGNF